jgi:hypothetical protein
MFDISFSSFIDGWLGRGIRWRQEFVAKNIHPERFLAMHPRSHEMLEEYLKLSPQSRVQALNILTRYNFFEIIRIR